MVKVIRLSLFLIAISLFLTGCSNSKEDITLDINKNENLIDTNNINQIISNDIYSKESEEQELINIIESVEKIPEKIWIMFIIKKSRKKVNSCLAAYLGS